MRPLINVCGCFVWIYQWISWYYRSFIISPWHAHNAEHTVINLARERERDRYEWKGINKHTVITLSHKFKCRPRTCPDNAWRHPSRPLYTNVYFIVQRTQCALVLWITLKHNTYQHWAPALRHAETPLSSCLLTWILIFRNQKARKRGFRELRKYEDQYLTGFTCMSATTDHTSTAA